MLRRIKFFDLIKDDNDKFWWDEDTRRTALDVVKHADR